MYFFWIVITLMACLLSAVVGLWIDRKIDEKKTD
ncbi:cytochrome bd oxidase small subunit, CydX/CbdX family [Orbus mooreae]